MSDVHDRLERLRKAGRLKRRSSWASPLRSPTPPTLPETGGHDLLTLPGVEEIAGSNGRFLLRTIRYELSYQQGRVPLQDLLQVSAAAATHLSGKDALPDFDFRHAVFIDTETTGLAGGTGTIVFLTGVGRFEADAYVVRQYFARNPAEEPAYLAHLAALLDTASGLVSFNGKAFDIPLLRTRFILAGLDPGFVRLPHLDLLHPARRLWRQRLGSCTLQQLETHILQHQRSSADVPSWQIPDIWFRYANGENNNDQIASVLSHNQEDIVSMAPLAHVLGGTLCGQLPPHPHDLAALARHWSRTGDTAGAEAAYQQALAGSQSPSQRSQLMLELASMLKRRRGRTAAVSWWQMIAADETCATVTAHIELAKYHEWESGQLHVALQWTEQALARAQNWRPSTERSQILAALEHRQQRLQRKLAAQAS
ncbi:MAG: ribonuclease H-like domain-containing protein [Chloroflexi bacterium]|nr:ribonuclease H-like domain-containing protein [Chloroflexota bacterium]